MFPCFPGMDEVCGVRAVQQDRASISWWHRHMAAGLCLQDLSQDRDTKLAQQAEGSFGVWGAPARLSPSSHRFIFSYLRASLGCQARETGSVWVLSPKLTNFCPHPEEGSHQVISVHSCPVKSQHHAAPASQGLVGVRCHHTSSFRRGEET